MSPSLATAIFWVAAALCVVAQVAIVRSALAPRASAAGGVPATRRALEILWAVVPAIGLALVLAWTWRAMQPTPTRAAVTAGAASPLPIRR